MVKKRKSLADRTVKTNFLYLPNTLEIFQDHARVKGVKMSAARAERLFALYRYFADEKDIVPWPKDRPFIEESLPYYKVHGDAVLDEDLKLLKKLGLVQEGIGLFKPSFTDVMFSGFL